MEKELLEYIKIRYTQRFEENTFEKALEEYQEINDFAPNGNINDAQQISDEAHFIMRLQTQYFIHKAFESMKIDMDDDNVTEDSSTGNIGTPGRIAKVWCGYDTEDTTELGSGRWSKKPRLAKFPNTNKSNIPITKRVDVISNCSHHFIPFTTLSRDDSYAIVSYIPKDYVLGISKLQRVTDWVSQRFFLQEDLTKMLYDVVSESAETESVYVGLFNMTHGCEMFRGSKSNDGAFTSECYSGAFKDVELRNQVKGR